MCGAVLCRSISFRFVLLRFIYTPNAEHAMCIGCAADTRETWIISWSSISCEWRVEAIASMVSLVRLAMYIKSNGCCCCFFSLLSLEHFFPVHYMEKLWATITPAAYVHILVLFDEFYVLWLCLLHLFVSIFDGVVLVRVRVHWGYNCNLAWRCFVFVMLINLLAMCCVSLPESFGSMLFTFLSGLLYFCRLPLEVFFFSLLSLQTQITFSGTQTLFLASVF